MLLSMRRARAVRAAVGASDVATDAPAEKRFVPNAKFHIVPTAASVLSAIRFAIRGLSTLPALWPSGRSFPIGKAGTLGTRCRRQAPGPGGVSGEAAELIFVCLVVSPIVHRSCRL